MAFSGKEEHGGFKNWLAVRFLPTLLALGMRVLGMTLRRIRVIHEEADALMQAKSPRIYIGWHTIAFATPWLLRKDKFFALVSRSRDGEMIATLLNHFGHGCIRGSSSRGGREALYEIIEKVQAGNTVFVTPDGPRGPAFRMQKGAIIAAVRTGAPLIPYHFEATDQWVIEKAWDKQRIPKPFSTVLMFIGKPIYLPPVIEEQDRERVLSEIETGLREHMEECRRKLDSYRKPTRS